MSRQNAKIGNALVQECLSVLKALGIAAWRSNTGTMKVEGRWVAFGKKGASDITGILPNGRRLEIECKRGRSRPTREQKAFQEMIRANGGAACVVRDTPEGLAEWIEEEKTKAVL